MTPRKIATKMVELKRQEGVSYLMFANRARDADRWNVIDMDDARLAKQVARAVRQLVVNAIEESRRASRARAARPRR